MMSPQDQNIPPQGALKLGLISDEYSSLDVCTYFHRRLHVTQFSTLAQLLDCVFKRNTNMFS